MRSTLLLVVAASLVGCLQPIQGSGVAETRTLTFDVPFQAVELSTLVDVDLSLGDNGGEITCDDNLLDLFEYPIVGNTLTIRHEWGVQPRPRTTCRIALQMAEVLEVRSSASGNIDSGDPLVNLVAVEASASGDIDLAAAGAPDALFVGLQGSGNVSIDDVLSSDELTVDSAASGDIRLGSIDVVSVDVDMSASGNVTLDGAADTLSARISASGDLDAVDLAVIDADVELAGSGNAQINASGTVRGRLSASGNLVVSGGADVDVSVSGSGTVRER